MEEGHYQAKWKREQFSHHLEKRKTERFWRAIQSPEKDERVDRTLSLVLEEVFLTEMD